MAYMQEQLERSIRLLGPHWVLHPNNRVQRLDEPLPEVFKWTPRVLTTKPKKERK